jgi:hypothetical protein
MNPIFAGILLTISSCNIFAADLLISCQLDDEKSRSFCKEDPRFAIACQRTYRINSDTKQVVEVNPGRILPDFQVRNWSDTTIELSRSLESYDGRIRETIKTRFDRLSGRMLEYSEYTDLETEKLASDQVLQAFEAARVKQIGAFGYLDRSTISAECKAAKQSF